MTTSDIIKERLKQVESREDRLDKLESEFLRLAAHELRNPLTIIKGALCLVKEGDMGEVNPKQYEMLDRANEQVDILNDIISKFLEMYRIEMRKLELFKEKLVITEVIEQVVREMGMQVSRKDLQMEVSSQKPMHYVLGDSHKIKEVIANLLSNAIKFSYPGGRVKVRVSEGKDNVKTEIIDNGEGMDKKLQNRLFKKFVTTNLANPKKGGGIGLGLAISKGIIEAHNGKIWAESKGHGKGSKFAFILPAYAKAPLN